MWYVFEIFKPHSQYLLGKIGYKRNTHILQIQNIYVKKIFQLQLLKIFMKAFY